MDGGCEPRAPVPNSLPQGKSRMSPQGKSFKNVNLTTNNEPIEDNQNGKSDATNKHIIQEKSTKSPHVKIKKLKIPKNKVRKLKDKKSKLKALDPLVDAHRLQHRSKQEAIIEYIQCEKECKNYEQVVMEKQSEITIQEGKINTLNQKLEKALDVSVTFNITFFSTLH